MCRGMVSFQDTCSSPWCCELAVGDGEEQESYDSEDYQENAEENTSNEEVGHSLLLGAGMGNAEGGDEGFGEPGEEFQGGVCPASGYGIGSGLFRCRFVSCLQSVS